MTYSTIQCNATDSSETAQAAIILSEGAWNALAMCKYLHYGYTLRKTATEYLILEY